MTKQRITIDGINIDLERKRVKNVNFTIYPPDGRVRVSAPRRMPEEKLRQVIRAKMPWIKRHQQRMIDQPRPVRPKFVTGERHLYFGKLYTLNVIETDRAFGVELGPDGVIRMRTSGGSSTTRRRKLLNEWYRRELKALIPEISAAWEPVIGVRVEDWGVKRMKTRWGSCNTRAHRIWVNLALAKHPLERLEYIIVHEMVHLLERGHNERFYTYMDRFLPDWRTQRAALKTAPVGSPKQID